MNKCDTMLKLLFNERHMLFCDKQLLQHRLVFWWASPFLQHSFAVETRHYMNKFYSQLLLWLIYSRFM